jgi:hypothetical protein
VPIVLGKNRSPAAIAKALDGTLPSSGYVDLVMAAAEDNETTLHVRAALEQRLYRLYRPTGQVERTTYGALEHTVFVAGPRGAALEPIGAAFEGGIELVAGGVLDASQAGAPQSAMPQPESPLRVAFEWRVPEATDAPPTMYVHLLRDGVELIAQRDGVLGKGLSRATEWKPGEVVRDRFALLLPPSLPAGAYELRVGLYDASTQRRYTLVAPEGVTFVVIQRWEAPGPDQEADASGTSRRSSSV